MDSRVRELAALAARAALGSGLAAVQGDLLFVAIFGAASVVTIIEGDTMFAVRQSRSRSAPCLICNLMG